VYWHGTSLSAFPHQGKKPNFSLDARDLFRSIQSIIEFINRWAYVMIGLYGFSYLEAGRNVIQLFQSKGWTVMITDDLGENVMFMISAAIGILTGLVGIVLSLMDSNMLDSLGMGNPVATGFLIGLLVGFVFSSIVLSVVGSAVNTAIVCYVEDPAAFQMNHPMLSNEMRQAWIEAWPGHT
jgi:Plasma-membrane choline transporter